MVKKILLSVVLCFGCVSLAFSQALVVDNANIFTAAEIDEFTTALKSFEQKAATQAVIVTVKTIDTSESSIASAAERYADDYFDYNDYGIGEEYDGFLLLLVTGDGTPGSGYLHISTHGSKTISALTDERIETLADELYYNGLDVRNYGAAVRAYIKKAKGYFFNEFSFTEMMASALSAVGAFFLSMFGIKKNNKIPSAKPFYNSEKYAVSHFSPFTDNLVSSNVTSRVIETTKSSGGGGSTTHRSSSGRTHGGGGRSF